MEEATREPSSLLLTERHQRGAVYLADQQRKVVDNNGKTTYFVNITNQEPGGGFHTFKTEYVLIKITIVVSADAKCHLNADEECQLNAEAGCPS
jgi:hypothetical protein